MIRRLIILVFLSGLPSISSPASIVNVDLIATDQEQDKADSPYESSEKSSYQRAIRNYSILKKNKSLPAQQSYSYIYQTLNVNQANAADFLNRAGISENSAFNGGKQDNLDEYSMALKEIKTSLKDMNTEWNRIENWAGHLFLDVADLPDMAPKRINLLTRIGDTREYVDTRTVNLDPMSYRDNLAYKEQVLMDQPLINQILVLLSLPHLLQLISDNLTGLVVIFVLWLLLKGLINFLKWKSEKRIKRRIRKDRHIDGLTKY